MKNRQTPHRTGNSNLFLLVLVTISGGLGLAYEVLWARVLALAAGHSLGAMSTVAATFMGGLALGSLLGERPALRKRSPLAVYGALELGIAAYAVVLPFLLPLIDPLADVAYRAADARPAFAVALQLGWAALLLLPPTTLMGATTPVLVRAPLAQQGSASRLAWIYGANSFGGALGALVVTFGLLPLLGHRATGWALAACGVAVGLTALRLGRGESAVARPDSEPIRIGRTGLMVAMLSGAVGMALEVAWSRALVLYIGSSTYAFSMILATFIFGLALGSHAAGLLMRRRFDASRTVGILLVVLGAAGIASLALIQQVPAWTAQLLYVVGPGFGSTCAVQVSLVAVVTLPATLALGMLLPLCARLEGEVGSTGHLYGFNTAGAVAGSLGATFVGIPFAGMAGTITAAALAPLAAGGFLAGGRRRLAFAAALAAAGLAAVRAIPEWDRAVMHSGPFVVARGLQNLAPGVQGDYTQEARDMGRILFHQEGPCVTVAVRESGNRLRTLVVNGKPDASTLLDMKTQRMVAHLPLALHADPKDVLVIGLGSGVTAGSVLRHPVRSSTVVELSPEVVAASRYFNPESGAPLDDPRTKLILADGRTHVFRTGDTYDAIVSEPTNPWISGVSSLFTREHFEKCKNRLRAGGVMGQWLQAYSLPADDFMSIVRTFRAVFPSATLWKAVGGADYILVGTREDRPYDLAHLTRAFRYEGVRRESTDVEIRDELDLLAHFICGKKGLDVLTAGARVQVDDRLDLEFTAPRRVGLGASEELLAVLEHLVESPQPYLAGSVPGGRLREVELRRERYTAYDLLRSGEMQQAVPMLSKIEETCVAERIPAGFLKGFYLAATNLMQDTGELAKAKLVLEGMIRRYPEDGEYGCALATLLARMGELERSRALFDDVLHRRADHPDAHRGLAVLDEARGDLRGALAHYRALQKVIPSDVTAAASIVRVLRGLDSHREAEEALRVALRTDPGLEGGAALIPFPVAPGSVQ